MSGRFPGGANSPEELWQILKSGTDAVTEASGDRWDLAWHHPDARRPGRIYTKAGGFLDRIDGFDADFFGMSPREVRQVDPQQRLLLELAWEVHEDAGIAPSTTVGSDTGVFVGISSNDYANMVGPEWPDAYSNTGSSFSIAANRISYIFDFHGPSVAVDTACSSSIVCVHQACQAILAGECSTALAGGISILTHIRPWLGFAKASMLSPTGRCKSFDASGDGYVRSEGGGLVMLKRLEDAERDGNRILGVILATGVNSDGRTMGLSMPNGDAQEALLRTVYGQCGVKPEEVFYIEAHGTGTAVGDPIECGALGRVLGEPRTDGRKVLMGSVKSNIGHLEAASGIAGLTKVLLALKHRELPANLHFNEPNPKIEFDTWKLDVVTQATPLPDEPVTVGINSFGFGGTNAHMVMREYRAPAPVTGAPSADVPQLLVLSGHTDAALREVAGRHAAYLRRETTVSFADSCAAAALSRDLHGHRLALIATTAADAATKLEAFAAGDTGARMATGTASGTNAPVAFVYSGNGPQWWGMGRELLATNAVFRAEIEAVDAIFAPMAGWSLLDEMARPEAENRIALTEVAQPMLFAMQLGLTQALRASGIEASAVLGHSVGEAAAAWASGALSREQATQVIYQRSQQQARTAGTGRMAALGVSADEARAAIAKIDGWLELAAVNSPGAVTVAGDPVALEQLVTEMTAAGKFARSLALNYPFHTKAMDIIEAPLLDALRDLAPGASTVPFISTVTGREVAGTELGAAYWYRNIRDAVLFDDAVMTVLKNKGIATFIEVGPHPVLKDYVLQSAKAASVPAVALPTLKRPGAKGPEVDSDNLAVAICASLANGVGDVTSLFQRPSPMPELPLYPWQRTRHWRGSASLPDVSTPTEREHELLGHRVPSATGLWQNAVDTNQLGYLVDHVVQDSVLFPAAGYIDMSLEAGRLAFGAGMIDVENVDIVRPLTIPAHGDPLVQTAVDVKDGTVEVHSKPERDAGDWTLHFRGRISRTEHLPAAEVTDVAALTRRMPVVVSAEAHYADSLNRGLAYGPQFQGVRSVRLTSPDAITREALAELHLDLDTSKYLAHPSMLDSAIQVLITLIAQNEPRNVSTIPVQIGRVRSLAPLQPQMLVHVTMQSESERSATATYRLMDMDGTLLMSIDEARCQKVDFGAASPTPRISEWWRPDTKTQPLEQPAALPSLAVLASQVACDLPAIIAASAREEYYREVQPRFETLAGAYASAAIAALQPGEASFDAARLARRAGVRREHMALLASLIEMSASEGQLVAAGGSAFKWNAEQVAVDPQPLWRELFQRHPRYHAELLLLASAGESLSAVLRGEEVADSRASLLDQLQDNAPFQAPYNQMLRAVLERMVAAWPVERPMRILEVNGGGAGLLAWVLPVLPAYRADYVFTDASEGAVARAEHRFSTHRMVRFETLDLTRDLLEQGQPAGFYDLVIASDLFDGSTETPEVLERLQTVMTPDAQLLVLHTTSDRFSTLALGAAAVDAPAALVSSGFDTPVAFDDAAACLVGQLPRRVILLSQRTAGELPAAREVSAPARRWMFVVECSDRAFTDAIVASMTLQGQRVVVHAFGDAPDLQAAVTEAVVSEPVDEIVYVSSPVGGDLFTTQSLRCLTAAHVVQALENSARQLPTLLTLVTRGAFPTGNGQGPLDPAQAPIWGLGRVIGNEHTSLKVRMIDLHANADDARCLVTELLRRDDETEVQLHRGHRYANRQRMNTMIELAQQAGARPEAYALDFLPQGGLDSLHLRPAVRRAPAAHEVEIAVKAAGLNFRDVLWSMGMLPEEAVEKGFSGPTIGMECAGEVVRVGAEVTNVKVGDRVVAFASNCFGSHVTTHAGSVAVMPESLDYASAATIPTAFLTAYYAFDHLARLEPGETVLIHGAAGGVGMAAIQIAKMKGAKVIGTAGTARKRRMLEMLGVDHALSSRSLDFADQVMQITNGVGVDVVLNSLAGEAITKSLQCLRPFGRFLEIGKRDLYANSRIGLRPFRINLSYFGIDADTLLVERADLARRMFHAVMGHFASGALKPIPFQEIPISRASEAFRAMQKSSHVGKLVVSMQLDRAASLPVARTSAPVRETGTYLVTGGLGGFGLSTARWLVAQGATSVALLSRRGATTDEAREGVAAMEAAGATVRTFACDIADPDSLDAVLTVVRAELAPLVGIVHSAAVIEDAPVLRMEAAQVARVFLPKLVGAWNLHRATLADPIEMFVMYSSSSASVGNPGQGAYVAANLYLDALAMQRHAMGLPALAVGWGAIKDAGFLTRHTAVAGMLKSRTGMDATPSDEALADLGALCSVGAVRMNVARFDLVRLGQMLPGARVPRFLAVIPKGAAAAAQSDETLADVYAKTPDGERAALVLSRVRDHAARVLGTSSAQVSVDQPLSNLGLDSLMAVELAGGLERDLGQPVSVMQMLSAGSLTAIADLVTRVLTASGELAQEEVKV